MAYITGTANSFADVLAALRNACTANGWTLAGNVLAKGTCFADIQTYATGSGSSAWTALRLQVGNGIDGGNGLTDASPVVYASRLAVSPTFPDWAWPIIYHIHILAVPDEVYLELNYNTVFWQRIAWGQSPYLGNQGTGNWVHGTNNRDAASNVTGMSISPRGCLLSYYSGYAINGAPFFTIADGNGSDWRSQGSYIHGAMDGTTGAAGWSNASPFSDYYGVSAGGACEPLLGYSPNAWNNAVVLFPIQVMQARPSRKSSIIGELGHMRYVRNDYLDDGAVITLGADRWKIYPMYRKNVAARDGGSKIDHSGTMAVAIRYDGP